MTAGETPTASIRDQRRAHQPPPLRNSTRNRGRATRSCPESPIGLLAGQSRHSPRQFSFLKRLEDTHLSISRGRKHRAQKDDSGKACILPCPLYSVGLITVTVDPIVTGRPGASFQRSSGIIHGSSSRYEQARSPAANSDGDG
jgi:hypothetical protein